MKQLLLAVALATLLFSCTQKTKTVQVKPVKIDTSTILKGTVKVGDYMTAMKTITHYEDLIAAKGASVPGYHSFDGYKDTINAIINSVLLKHILDTTANPILKLNAQDTVITYN